MQIGEKVRFLNEVGGGIISGFQGKDIVLVEDEDGFDIPMLRSQVVVVETNANNFVRKPKTQKPAAAVETPRPAATPAVERQSLKAVVNANLDAEEEDVEPGDRPLTFQAKPKERKGGELLNVCLAFVPEDSRELTTTRFEAYLINDSNYFISVVLANNEGAAWHLRWQGTMEPNTKQHIETFDRSILNDLQRLSVQLIAWKQDRPYLLKPAIGVELRLDTVKFYKLHVFQPSPFFREPALIYDIVRGDRPIRQVFVEAEEVLDAMRGGLAPERPITERPTPDPSRDGGEASGLSGISGNSGLSGISGISGFSGESVESAPEEVLAAPTRTRAEEREALKAAKRALKAEQKAEAAKQQAKSQHSTSTQTSSQPTSTAKPLPSLAGGVEGGSAGSGSAVLEVDLHINALLDNTTGLSPAVLLNTQLTEFRIIMDRNIRKKGQRIVFIHGKGDGVLREAIIKELRRRYRTCTYEDADFQRYGYGATLVTIR